MEEKYDFKYTFNAFDDALREILDTLELSGDYRKAVAAILEIIDRFNADVSVAFSENPAVYIETRTRDPAGEYVAHIEAIEEDEHLGDYITTILLEKTKNNYVVKIRTEEEPIEFDDDEIE